MASTPSRDSLLVRLFVGHEEELPLGRFSDKNLHFEDLPLDSESDPEDKDYEVGDDEFNDFDSDSEYESNSDADDDDVIQSRKTMKKMRERMTIVNEHGEREILDLFDEHEFDSEFSDSDEAEEVQREGHSASRVKRRVGLVRQQKGVDDIVAGAQFLNKEHFVRSLHNYRITKGYSVKVRRSNKTRCQAVCLGDGCEWTCWSSPLGRELTWVVKSISKPHTCIPFTYQHGKRHITFDWLCDKYIQLFIDMPGMKVREFKGKAERELDMKLSHTVCNEARRKAVIKILGDYRAQFGQLRAYCNEVATLNPGSTLKIKSFLNEKGEAVFSGMYICIDSLRKGFLDGCRRVISLDGCFLKGPWAGQLLAAVGRDANNQMYPIAWGLAESETTESWRWFIELLQADLGIGNGEGWTIISDQQKGLINAVHFLCPNVEHRMCARHVYANVRKWWRGLSYKNIFWKLAKSSNIPHFEKNKALFQNLSTEAWEFVEKKEPKHFCRLYFNTHAKCDSVDNNMAEVFNATIVEARFKPIITMLDDIFTVTMTRVARRYKWACKLNLPIAPRILTKLQKRAQKANFWAAHEAGNGLWSVRHGLEGFVVALEANTCTCGSWQLSGLPCVHAIAVFRENGVDPYTCVHDCYAIDYLKATYQHAIHPINGVDMWREPEGGGAKIVAPFFTLKRKGLRTKRILEEGEVRPSGRVSRAGTQKCCSRCKKLGHNKKGCKEILPHEQSGMPTGNSEQQGMAMASEQADLSTGQAQQQGMTSDQDQSGMPTGNSEQQGMTNEQDDRPIDGYANEEWLAQLDVEIEDQRKQMLKYPIIENMICGSLKEMSKEQATLHEIPTQQSQTTPSLTLVEKGKGVAKYKLRKTCTPLSSSWNPTSFTMRPKIPVRRKTSVPLTIVKNKKAKMSDSSLGEASSQPEMQNFKATAQTSQNRAASVPTMKTRQ